MELKNQYICFSKFPYIQIPHTLRFQTSLKSPNTVNNLPTYSNHSHGATKNDTFKQKILLVSHVVQIFASGDQAILYLKSMAFFRHIL
jgi:hypothetical protein